LACGDQRRLTGNGSALEDARRCTIQIHDFTLLYFNPKGFMQTNRLADV